MGIDEVAYVRGILSLDHPRPRSLCTPFSDETRRRKWIRRISCDVTLSPEHMFSFQDSTDVLNNRDLK